MREKLAKLLAAFLTGLVVLMAAFFARQRNEVERITPAPVAERVPPPPTDATMVARGRGIFEARACERCHSVDGRGNPRSPLDGVGARLGPGSLLDALTGTGAAADRLTRSTVRAKEAFIELSPGDLAALVAYLSSLR